MRRKRRSTGRESQSLSLFFSAVWRCGQREISLLSLWVVDSSRRVEGMRMLETLVGFPVVVDESLNISSRATVEKGMMGVATNRTRGLCRTLRQLMTAFQALKTEAKFHDGSNLFLH